MGVRQLQTFIQKAVPNGYIEVSLQDECASFKKKNHVKPILVIDVMGFLSPLIKCYKELLCGLRHNILLKSLDELLKKLSSMAELVFFEDGHIEDAKLAEWIRRQRDRLSVTNDISDKINNGWPLDKIVNSHNDIPSVTSHLCIIEELSKKYGILRISYDRECDLDMAAFACRNSRVLAIMADDSDFLIFPGNWRYFSLRSLNHGTFVTREYNRVALRNFLNLNESQMILLSTLNGNDLIPFDETTNFHRTLLKQTINPIWRFPAIAKFIRDKKLNTAMCINIASMIYKVINEEVILKVQSSLNSYNIDIEDPFITDNILLFCRDNYCYYVYSKLKNMIQMFTLDYFDTNRSDDYYNTIVRLFQKQIGILFKSQKYQMYQICSKRFHSDNHYFYLVHPLLRRGIQPDLCELLNRSKYPQHDKIRFTLLKWLIGEKKLQNVDLETIPKNIFCEILMLTYMVVEKFIDIEEADILLLTIKQVKDDAVPEHLKVPVFVHPRAFYISMLFSRCFISIDYSLQVTGLFELLKIHTFDGVLFQNLYWKYYRQPSQVLQLLGDYNSHRYYK